MFSIIHAWRIYFVGRIRQTQQSKATHDKITHHKSVRLASKSSIDGTGRCGRRASGRYRYSKTVTRLSIRIKELKAENRGRTFLYVWTVRGRAKCPELERCRNDWLVPTVQPNLCKGKGKGKEIEARSKRVWVRQSDKSRKKKKLASSECHYVAAWGIFAQQSKKKLYKGPADVYWLRFPARKSSWSGLL